MKEGINIIFFIIFLILIFAIITIKVKIELINFKFNSQKENKLDRDYKIRTTIYIFKKLPILKSIITNEKLKTLIENKKIKEVLKKQEIKIIENRKEMNKEILKNLKNIKINIKEIDLKVYIGTEDIALTAIIIPVISTVISIFLKKLVEQINKKQKFIVQPVYNHQNLINIQLDSIFEIEMIHIINTICKISKMRKGDKNERTSNRRTYDYGYE